MQAARSAFFVGMKMFFRFYAAKIPDCVFHGQGGPHGAWLAGKKSSSLRCGIFSRQALPGKSANPVSGSCKIGKKHPDGVIHLKMKRRYENQNHPMHRQDSHDAVPAYRRNLLAAAGMDARRYPCGHHVGRRNCSTRIPCPATLFQSSRMAGTIRNFRINCKNGRI